MNQAEDVTVVIPSIPPRVDMRERAANSSTDHQLWKPGNIIIPVDYTKAGAAATRNRGLMRVETEFVAFLDDDDQMLPNHLMELVIEQRRTGADVVYPWFVMNGNPDPLGAFGKPFDPDELQRRNYIPITVLARTQLLKDVGGFIDRPDSVANNSPATNEDWHMWLRLLATGATFVHLPKKTWVWNHHGGNTGGRGDRWIAYA